MPKTVMIIDDEEDIRTYLMAVLESNGYETYSSSNAKNGIELLQDIKPDLICLDIMMPHETGFSFYKKFRQNEEFYQIPVIIISGAIESGKFKIKNCRPI